MGSCLTCFRTAPNANAPAASGGPVAGPDGTVPHDPTLTYTDTEAVAHETDDLLPNSPLGPHMALTERRSGGSVKKSGLGSILNGNIGSTVTSGGTGGGVMGPAGVLPGAGGTVECTNNNGSKELSGPGYGGVGGGQLLLSDNDLNKLFESYKDAQDDAILSEGIERLCGDLGFKPDDFAILVLAWRLDASQMCQFTKTEFIQGLQRMNAASIEDIRSRLQQIVERLRTDGTEDFKSLYRFTFRFGLEPGHRILSLDMAISLWRLVFTVHTPDILQRWLDFLEQQENIRGVPKDTWNMFLNFVESCDIENYDDTEAWPSLFDDFVEYEQERTGQLKKDANAAAIDSGGDGEPPPPTTPAYYHPTQQQQLQGYHGS
ncbi:DCN1-like protein 3 isoform X1 [Anopheles bellator]|uniref:DCN1-like protein 3 isoform X1 n=1 Tax=Anopheles bellator TaxID=139047 RepID=UPI0026472FF4|nr:DCN1-like protein 3 isoform X1 [Anopheles bellator]XP_058062371.1 DCN1-like protein 3 isoform X1 [Anopheles bellator]